MFHNNFRVYQTNFEEYNIEIEYFNVFTDTVERRNIDVNKEQMENLVGLLTDLDFDDHTPGV
jgi:hypothetical protein